MTVHYISSQSKKDLQHISLFLETHFMTELKTQLSSTNKAGAAACRRAQLPRLAAVSKRYMRSK